MPLGTWICIACECAVLSGGGLCNGPSIRPEESYRVCVCVTECVSEAPTMRGPRSTRAAEIRENIKGSGCTL